MDSRFPTIARLGSVAEFRKRLQALRLALPVDEEVLSVQQHSPLAEPGAIGSFTVGNRWCIHPMEGWDAREDGTPSEHTFRRWENFGKSGAKLIWGGEAAAVVPEGRGNPNQMLAVSSNRRGLAELLDRLRQVHLEKFGETDDLLVGLQLTHSGRFCCPREKSRVEPRIAYHHPLLDAKFHIDPDDSSMVLTDDEVEGLMDDYVAAAGVARDAGYQFVDVKACHGYLVHEFLSARKRVGRFGGDFEGRTRLLRETVGRIRAKYPDLSVAVRLSVFDVLPHQTSRGIGRPMEYQHLLPYEFGFGMSAVDPRQMDLSEPIQLLRTLVDLGVVAVNVSCGSPYYNPHAQRPALFPPSDGYQPPEDPLVGVERQIQMARQCKQAVPELPLVGTGYSYLQDYLPHVAQAVIREGWIDFVGLGRMVLSYPEMPADILSGGQMRRKRICRTFSDCTTGPRNGLISGCFPLDSYYKNSEAGQQMRDIKQSLKE